MKKFPFYQQPDAMNCGPTCLRMIAKYYGRVISLEKLLKLSETTREGSSLKNISDAAEKIGFRTIGVKIDFNTLQQDAPLPCIVHWKQNHFLVVYKISKQHVYVADPGHGILKYSIGDFLKNWIGDNTSVTTEEGIALLLEPTPRLKKIEDDDLESKKGFSFLYQYVFRYKKYIFQLMLGLLLGSLMQLIFPFLTQSVVDIGIQNQDINFIYLILIAQLFLFIGKTSVDIIRGWILLHLSTRINISLISDFFIKLMNLPIAYFDSKMTGDIMQRINDHQRIENLLTSTSLNTLFSFFNLIIFGGVLAWYDLKIFGIFFLGSTLYLGWILLFLKRRKDLDYKRFSQMGNEQSKVMELINGMQEIKLHNAEKQKRWGWEFLQARLFKISMKGLVLEQIQNIGSSFINELKNIFITIFSAKLVIDGQITLGMMMAISYIIGQLNNPIQQLIGFIYSAQDAKIALERLSEIHNREDEEPVDEEKVHEIPADGDFVISDLHFRYKGSHEEVLKGLNLTIPSNKITAIVGTSGSGKTTLLKLLLKFYEPEKGSVRIGNVDLGLISQKTWRSQSGAVMQEGYIFNDTIANNIAVGEDLIDKKRLKKAVEIANIGEFIDELPLGYNTKIGMEGTGMSTGQKQRLLIARAVYKEPKFIFFDEATSALDANNERVIMEQLDTFFKGRTAIVIAHRLSTVKNADQIVVLEHGIIAEKGTHTELVKLRGKYYDLVKNQLELGN
ncbi:peptidase domain-containing ABC transporter [Fluviicola taffensis]|uniref:Peptide-transporting ATPase n=1 Tax=Fluviicola taffensis (strain DSM 16823 / NCIMB 13979 / RW262) TaxID=755732 RepID=F2IIL6_FLUTR|nr:peptidase domain-containing ABC transporter [Fluviicola taffensis]AEA45978.1 Peptide-transporting ATPase [Fluviicola taffensis DSM 16823]